MSLTVTLQSDSGATGTLTIPDPVVTSGSQPVLIGARNHDLTFPQADGQIGPLRATRVFWQGFPSTAGPVTDQTTLSGAKPYPATTQLWVSVKSTTNLEAWASSVPDPSRYVVIPNHEPENGDFTSGAAFKVFFNGVSDRLKAVNPAFRVCHAAAGSTYVSGKAGYDGSYIPDPGKCDIYTIDIYRPSLNLMKPLSQDVRFQRWLSFTKGMQAIGITEWGIGLPADDPTLAPLRPGLIAQDRAYLRTLPNFVTAQFWYTLGLDGKDYRPTDAASIAALKDLAVNGL